MALALAMAHKYNTPAQTQGNSRPSLFAIGHEIRARVRKFIAPTLIGFTLWGCNLRAAILYGNYHLLNHFNIQVMSSSIG